MARYKILLLYFEQWESEINFIKCEILHSWKNKTCEIFYGIKKKKIYYFLDSKEWINKIIYIVYCVALKIIIYLIII